MKKKVLKWREIGNGYEIITRNPSHDTEGLYSIWRNNNKHTVQWGGVCLGQFDTLAEAKEVVRNHLEKCSHGRTEYENENEVG